MNPKMSEAPWDDPGDPVRDGDVWWFPSGHTLPVVAGGSDDGTLGGDGADAPGSDPAGEPPPPPPQVDPEVARLRRENAAWRTRAQALEGIDPDTAEVLDPLLQAIRRGDAATIQDWILGQYESLPADVRARLNAQAAQGQQAPTGPAPRGFGQPPDPNAPLTRAELEAALRAERTAQAEEAQRAQVVAQINTEFRQLGIDPTSPLARAVAQQTTQMQVEQQRPVTLKEGFDAFRAALAGVAPPAPTPGPPGQVPPPLPTGAPTAQDAWTNATPKERAKMIMQGQRA